MVREITKIKTKYIYWNSLESMAKAVDSFFFALFLYPEII